MEKKKKITINDLAKEVRSGFKSTNELIENLAVAVKKGFDHVDERLNNLDSDVSILKNDVSTLKGTSLEMSRDISDIKDELQEMNGRMNRVEDVAIVDNDRRLKRLEKVVFPARV